MPGYVALDAMLGYDYEQWSMQLRVRNLLDKYSYIPSYSGNYIGISEGRAFLFQAKYAFN
jgi:iron complex outermembrane receptor protein